MKTIGLHENEINQVNENLKILKEEKIMVSNELINLMNLRENYEDIIKMRAKYIVEPFKFSKEKCNRESEFRADSQSFERAARDVSVYTREPYLPHLENYSTYLMGNPDEV